MAAAQETAKRRQESNRFVSIMAKHPEICCFLVAVLLTCISKYTKSSTKIVSPEQPPRRVFARASPVVDIYYGNLYDVGSLLQNQEILVVMYYAPWCAKSMALRAEYDKAARYLEEVTFVAINCWYPKGSCRQQNNFLSFPVLYYYQAGQEGFRYNGPLTAEYLVNFVQKLMYPLTPIFSMVDLDTFIARTDNAVVGFFDFNASPQPPGYQQFYFASLRVVERDPRNPIEFGVITNSKLAKEAKIKKPNTVFLYRHLNKTLKYPNVRNFTASAITKWVMSRRQQSLVHWILPTGSKSLVLSSEIEKGPALILFTPHSPLSPVNQYLYVLRELALDYHNCENSSRIQDTIHSLVYHRWAVLLQQFNLLDMCRNLRTPGQKPAQAPVMVFAKHCCHSIYVGETPNKYNTCDVCVHHHSKDPFSRPDCSFSPSILSWLKFPHSTRVQESDMFRLCQEVRTSYHPQEFVSMCCARNGHIQSSRPSVQIQSPIRVSTDKFVRDSVKNRNQRKCRKLKFRRWYNWGTSVNIDNLDLHNETFSGFTGLGCRTNKTLNFYAMDSKQSYMFSQKLGIDEHMAHNFSGVVLFDKQNEVYYIMKEEYKKANIVKLIKDYTEGTLTRHLRTEQPVSPICDNQAHDVCIIDVTSSTFQDVVLNNDKDVVLLYYAPWCGFCAGFAHIYLSLARYFRAARNIIFARINADENDVSWPFTVDRYPTIHFIPAHRSVDSIAFPEHLMKTLPNLIQFVLHYATKSLKVHTALNICARTCIGKNISLAAKRIRVLHSEIYALKSRIIRVYNRAEEFRTLSQTTNTKVIRGEYNRKSFRKEFKEKADLLHWHVKILKNSLERKELQMRNARRLHKVLVGSHGSHMQQHRLINIVKGHKVHWTHIQSMAHQAGAAMPWESAEQKIPAVDPATDHQVHDEL